ncbi:LppP/LprE family lipoprotein [Nocardia thailandica]
MSVLVAAFAAVAASLVACTGEQGTTGAAGTSAAPVTSSARPEATATGAPSPEVEEAPGGRPTGAPATGRPGGEATAPTVAPAPETTPARAADDIGGPGRCIDPASAGVRRALAGLGGGWVASGASTDAPGECGQLLWVRAVGGNSAAAPIHLLFFHAGAYLGTATWEPYAFTSVSGSNGNSVTAQYKWLAGDEPFAAPQGGPATITYTWTGSSVAMSGPLPKEVTEPHR